MTILEAYKLIKILEDDLKGIDANIEYDRKRIEEAKTSDREDDAKYYENRIKEDTADRRTVRELLEKFYSYHIKFNLE